MRRFDETNLEELYGAVAQKDRRLQRILDTHGVPPVWIRPNSFETLVLTILEQQVSLASAYAAFVQLKKKISIEPAALLQLTDDELRSCYFSRQKIGYVRGLASALLDGTIHLEAMEDRPDDEIRMALKQHKGIGDWTVDIYLIHALRRTDVLPIGDLALVNGFRMMTECPGATKDDILRAAVQWQPLRSLATMLIWHDYIIRKGIRLLH